MNVPTTFPNVAITAQRMSADVMSVDNELNYLDESKIFNHLDADHKEEITRVDRRRELRKNRISLKEIRDKGQILSDELVIPDRTIDTNIRQQKSPYTKYIESPTTVLAFTDPSSPELNLTPLAVWHSDLVRVGSWKRPYFNLIDAILLHGAGYMEVVYSPNAPSHSVVEYIRREDLIFAKGTKNIQAAGRVFRRYMVTKSQLSIIADKYGFDKTQLAKVETTSKGSTEEIRLFKCFMRTKDGRVHIAWRADNTAGCDNWLKAPEPLDLNIVDVQIDQNLTSQGVIQPISLPTPRTITRYPLFIFPYHVEEDEVIIDVQGRAALDLHAQDMLTSLWSGTVNGVTRASRFYPTRKAAVSGETPRNTELFTLKHGVVYEGDFNVFQPNYPNTIAIAVAEALSNKKSQEIGATNYAAMNRNDTRKTATELQFAREEADNLSGPNISLFSMNMLEMEQLRWEILRSAIQQEILVIPDRAQRRFKLPLSVPDVTIFSPTLLATMAADSQVVRRAQRQSKFAEHWPIVQASPYALPYLNTFLQELFPDEFPKWQQEIGQTNQQVAQLTDMLKRSVDMLSNLPPETVPPESQDDFVNFLNAADQLVNPQQNAQPNAGGGSPP